VTAAAYTGVQRVAFVYSIHDPAQRAVKIGWAYDPERRLREIQTAHARTKLVLRASIRFENVDSAMSAEKRLHECFAEHRLHGEWFDDSILEDAPDADACTPSVAPASTCGGAR